jgi:hypothetical protein
LVDAGALGGGGEEMETKRDRTGRARQRAKREARDGGRGGTGPSRRGKGRGARHAARTHAAGHNRRAIGLASGLGRGGAALVCCVPRVVGVGRASVRGVGVDRVGAPLLSAASLRPRRDPHGTAAAQGHSWEIGLDHSPDFENFVGWGRSAWG